MLTPIGLSLNFIGAIVLLGTDVKIIERGLEIVDPVHRLYVSGLNYIRDKSTVEEMVEDNRAHPYGRTVSAYHAGLWPVLLFIERHVEQTIPPDAEIDISGGWVTVDGQDLTFPETREIQLSGQARLNSGRKVSLGACYGLINEARIKRIYIYGVCLLALGFFLQLIASLGALTSL